MSSLMSELEPQGLWHYFFALCEIPRGSGHEQAAVTWCMDQARALGCQVRQDAIGNVIIQKAASKGKEGRPTICMQAHVDMVWEKNEDTRHDFLTDPIVPYREGEWLKAQGTTLGADNGIGLAAGLAALADPALSHGPLEMLITVEEETTMGGAENLEAHCLKAKYLLNLDNEDEGYLNIGSAGGIDMVTSRPVAWGTASGQPYRLKVSGLKGGHSGQDIHLGRANAIRLLAHTLQALQADHTFAMGEVKGGNQRNAIPREASAILFLGSHQVEAFKQAVAAHESHWRGAFASIEPDMCFTLEAVEGDRALSQRDAQLLLQALLVVPHGVEAMSPHVQGLTQTSNNLAIVRSRADCVEIICMARSSIDASQEAMVARVMAALSLAGFHGGTENHFPGWKPEPEAELVQWAQKAYQSLYGKPMVLTALHAGLECSFIGKKHPGMEMVSIGPDIRYPHSPDEELKISSVKPFWDLLKRILENA